MHTSVKQKPKHKPKLKPKPNVNPKPVQAETLDDLLAAGLAGVKPGGKGSKDQASSPGKKQR